MRLVKLENIGIAHGPSELMEAGNAFLVDMVLIQVDSQAVMWALW